MSNIYQLVIAIWSITASIPMGDWRNLDKYYPTLLYFAVGNLTYEYIAHFNFHLWKMSGDGLFPEIIADFIALFLIVIPAILIFLSNYPSTPKERIIHIVKWVLIFTMVEWIGGKYFNAIIYTNGWNIWWSFLFNAFMFPMLRLHYLSFKKALVLSIPFTLLYLFWFNYL